jgi:hypothetical protein
MTRNIARRHRDSRPLPISPLLTALYYASEQPRGVFEASKCLTTQRERYGKM